MSSELILEANNITKVFPGVRALNSVDFKVRRGEVHALIGENGAGKSTLMKIILGSHQPTSGEMKFKGKVYKPRMPLDALKIGISMIHQEISLVSTMSVSDNIWIGREDKFGNGIFTNKKRQEKATKEILNQLGLDIDSKTEVSKLSIAQMQLVEIARAVSYDSDVIIMDEPTSALTDVEVEKLYLIIESLKIKGKSVIFISHKLEEIFRVCDVITVLRDGNFVTLMDAKVATKKELVAAMVGRELTDIYPKQLIEIGEPCLEVKGFTKSGRFTDIDFTVYKGEILGFAGLIGSGRTEIMRAVFGVDSHEAGQLFLHGREVQIKNSSQAIKHKLSMVTEDRLRCGAFHSLSVKFNISIAYVKSITSKFYWVTSKKEQKDVKDMVDKLSIKVSAVDSEISQLSGGNQQKVIIAKWLLTDPEVLILDEPTRGIDVGAKAEIYKLIGSLAAQGKAIILISSELPELMGLSDRIIVINEGRLAGEFSRSEFNQENIMSCAFGQ